MRKGKNFVMQEEKHLCKFMLHVSQDSIIWNGQKS
jgi:hypothetical protein